VIQLAHTRGTHAQKVKGEADPLGIHLVDVAENAVAGAEVSQNGLLGAHALRHRDCLLDGRVVLGDGVLLPLVVECALVNEEVAVLALGDQAVVRSAVAREEELEGRRWVVAILLKKWN